MTELIADECVLTPEQRRRLGQVYRLILSWRRKSPKGMPEGSRVQPNAEPEQQTSGTSSPLESES